MGKRAHATSKPPTDRQTRAARTANAKRDIKPENAATDIESLVASWHVSYVERERWKVRADLDSGAVKKAMVAAELKFVATERHGTPTLQERSGPTNIDWEALARANVDRDVIERELSKYTSVGAPSVALNAPREWGIEAKSKAAS